MNHGNKKLEDIKLEMMDSSSAMKDSKE